ncbi:MAG TPA: YerC/YecD family TrpR-related protein [Clostridia bacterium]|nr:YerC/YecD family TrpR-related protein [Clostridia bacterium]
MYESKLHDEDMDALFKAVLSLETEEDCYRFFEDLCTISELQAMSQRFAVARLLRKGETYTVIAERTGASTATISRVNRCLVYGAAGYRGVLDKLGE